MERLASVDLRGTGRASRSLIVRARNGTALFSALMSPRLCRHQTFICHGQGSSYGRRASAVINKERALFAAK